MSKKNNRRTLFYSVISLLLCVSMLLGTTLAWFSDSVSSTGNIIKTGKLDVTMEYTGDLAGEWADASDATIFSGNYWEPGYSDMKFIRVSNTGNLAFSYQMHILPAVQAAAGSVNLADVIDVYVGVVDADFAAPTAFSTQMTGMSKLGTLAEVMAAEPVTGVLLPTKGAAGVLPDGVTADTGAVTYCVVLHMQEDAGNEYQNLTVGNNFTIQLVANQYTYEQDIFGGNYDANAEWPYLGINYSVYMPIEGLVDPETNCLTEAVMVGEPTDDQFALIPAGVKVVEGTEMLVVSVTSMEKTKANVRTTTRDEILRSIDVHVEGVAEDNTVPMTFGLKELFPIGLNSNNVKLFHVEDGATKEMTVVDTPVNHNEFSYDPLTGDVVMTIASFSEVATYADTDARWDGETVKPYTEEGNTIKIANAEQFAYFRDQVDAGNSFEGKTVMLVADINLNNELFDPIGWGYENSAWNRKDANGEPLPGKVFKGTFDGNYKTIYGLYQDGWDLESATGTDYTYTNCGFGLFAAAHNATFKNLTIDGANIRVECVETGVLVGLAQGNCKFENININGCKAANYQRPVGGVVGEVSPNVVGGEAVASTHTFNNVKIDSNTVIGSLWGDFDAPVGGVIGAYWDDAGKTYVDMKNVIVACELDVYNDVTSTYQWYAYRRAGMLIGNTDYSEKNENGTNVASTKINGKEYLTCNNVIVFYGNWANYHYCEFYDSNPNWPWVRVEPGENCSGYSNPRWGRATDPVTKEDVVDSVHNHGNGESHMESIPFHQLYGGGQGVYGAEIHTGVKEGIYTVTYMDHGEILHVDYVTETGAYTNIWSIDNVVAGNGDTPEKWVDANGNDFTGVKAGNTANVVVYPKWADEYTIRCLDTYGNVVYYNFAKSNSTDAYLGDIATEINAKCKEIQDEVDYYEKVIKIKWKDSAGKHYTEITAANLKSSGADIILKATPELLNGSIILAPINDTKTGELVAYRVSSIVNNSNNVNVVIPEYIGTIPVTTISANAAAGFDHLHAVTIPKTVTTIEANAFASDWDSFDNGETITLYYEGSLEDWQAMENAGGLKDGWADGMSSNSRIFFMNGGTTVDVTQGYLQAEVKGYTQWDKKVNWSTAAITSGMKTEYTSVCDCSAPTGGDTAHTYLDASGNVMNHNDDGTPVNSAGTTIYLKESGLINKTYKLTDGTVDTYKRYRPDKAYWEGVEIN